jgi:hypothetical protein
MSSSRPFGSPSLARPALVAAAASALLSAVPARAQTAPAPPDPVAAPAKVEVPPSPAPTGAASWHQGDPVPAGYHPAHRVKKALVASGASLFALPYLASSIVAASGYKSIVAAGGYKTDAGTVSARGFLWIPAAGPFIMMGSTTSAAADVLLVLDGLAQIGGLTLFVYGAASPETVLAPDDGQGKAKISIAPLFTRGTCGAALVGTF